MKLNANWAYLLVIALHLFFYQCKNSPETLCFGVDTEEALYCTKNFKSKNGKAYGPVTYFHDNGNIAIDMNYIEDVPSGKANFYYDSGELKEVGYFKEGKPVDVWKSFYKSGVIQEYRFYENDSLIYYKEYNELGFPTHSVLPLKIEGFDDQGVNNQAIKIKLLHSELDTPYLIVFLSLSGDEEVFDDTVYTKGYELFYEWGQYKRKTDAIFGYVIEADSNFTSIGETPFYFPE